MIHSFNSKSVSGFGNDSPSVQFNHAVDFCKDWLNGKQEFIFHTSGSTGVPKKISLKRNQLVASANATINALQLNSCDHFFVCLNTQLIAGTMMLVRGMTLSCEMYIDEPTSNPLKNISENHDFTFASFVPMQLHSILINEQNVIKLNRFRNILVGGSSINQVLEKKLAELTCNVFHTYGMTETVSHIALRKIGVEESFSILPDVEIQKDERDCLKIKSLSTANKWITTNDIVDFESKNKFKIIGRADEIINSGGVKIYPAKIEKIMVEVLNELQMQFDELFVSSEKDELLGQEVIAIICGKSFSKDAENTLFEKLKSKISKYEVPKKIYFLPSFERTKSGKTDKIRTLEHVFK